MFRLLKISDCRRIDNSESQWIIEGEHPVTTLEAVIFGMLLSWTPCVVLMAYLLWRAPLESD
jgi:hypothetical protein